MIYCDASPGMFYDTTTQTYVGYFRDWMQGPMDEQAAEDLKADPTLLWKRFAHTGRRSIGIAETKDFRKFPLPRVAIEPSPAMSPNQVFYLSMGKTTFPEAPDQHLLFTTVWDTVTDTTHVEMFASHDARLWHSLPGGDVLHTAAPGQWDGGCVFAVPSLSELPNGDFALPYAGYNVPHKYPRRRGTRNTGYALWPKGRLAALEAVEEGGFTTIAVVPPANQLLINAATHRAGHLLVEAADLALQRYRRQGGMQHFKRSIRMPSFRNRLRRALACDRRAAALRR